MMKKLISHFFPNHCLVCEKEIDPAQYLCADCLGSIKGPIMTPFELKFVDSAFSYWKYESPLKELIRAYKFEDRPGIASLLSEMLFEMINTFSPSADVIVPVPTSIQAFVKRGFDTNLRILRRLSKTIDIRIDNVLTIAGKSIPQSRLMMEDRFQNVKDKFYLKRSPRSTSVILFDDVVTTGATASQCARVLKEGGVKEITLLAIAGGKK